MRSSSLHSGGHPMRRLHGQILKVLLTSALVGCGFTPGAADGIASGGGGSSGNSTASGGGGVNGGGGALGVGLTGGGGDIMLTGSGGMTCGGAKIPVMPLPPDILIVQDKSASMNDNDADNQCNGGGCGAASKWSELTMALGTVVQATDTTVNWGLKYFSDNNACDASNAPAVTIGATNGAAVTASIMGTQPGGNTPTRDA